MGTPNSLGGGLSITPKTKINSSMPIMHQPITFSKNIKPSADDSTTTSVSTKANKLATNLLLMSDATRKKSNSAIINTIENVYPKSLASPDFDKISEAKKIANRSNISSFDEGLKSDHRHPSSNKLTVLKDNLKDINPGKEIKSTIKKK